MPIAPTKIPLTQAQYNAKVAELATLGVQITGNAGQISKDGITIGYAYDGVNLTLTILHKPFGVPYSFIQSKIDAWFAQA